MGTNIGRDADPLVRAEYFLRCEGYELEAKAVKNLMKSHRELCDSIYNLSPVMELDVDGIVNVLEHEGFHEDAKALLEYVKKHDNLSPVKWIDEWEEGGP